VGTGPARRVRQAAAAALVVPALLASALAAPPSTSAGILPVAVPDSYSAVHGTLRTVAGPGVLGNDLQLGGGFTADLVNDVDHGTLDLDPDGGFTYRSDATYVGTDTFRYRVDGGLLGLSNVATVTISVTNDPPVASPDAYTAVADVEKSVAAPGVLGDDHDPDGDDLTMDVVQEPAHGNLNEDDDGSFRYKADKGFSGTDTWRYRASDGFAWSNTVTVTMTVSGPPATPTPTPAPTPRPTPTPTPRPSLPLPSIPLPSIPLPSIPLPSILPLPTRTPEPTSPTARPSAGPTSTPSPSDSPGPTDGSAPATSPSPGPSGSPGAGGPAGPVGSSGGGGSPSGAPPNGASPVAPPIDAFVVPVAEGGSDVELDPGFASFGGFEWAVPALVLTVPGILIVIAVLVQALIGLAWLPLVRRSLDGDRRRRAALARVSAR
jgi:Bacterial Ig domain